MARNRSYVQAREKGILDKGVGPLELEVLGLLWESGPASSRDVFEKTRLKKPYAQSTILTVLRRLCDRGLLRREDSGTGFLYYPVLSREDVGKQMADQLVSNVYGGDAAALIAYLSQPTVTV